MPSLPPDYTPPPGFRYELSEWPICLTVRTQTPTDEAYAQHLRNLDSMLARPERQVHIMTTEGESPARPAHIKMQAAWNERSHAALARNCLGVGMVIQSTLQRLGMGAMLATMKKPVPYQVFGNTEAALAWARRVIAKHAGTGEAGTST